MNFYGIDNRQDRPVETVPVEEMPFDVETVAGLVVAAGLADDADTARLLIDLDVVRVDTLASDASKYLVNVNGRQAVVSAPSVN